MVIKHGFWSYDSRCPEEWTDAAALYTLTMVGKEPDELLQTLLDKVDTVPKTNKSKDKSDNEKIADFLWEIGL